MDALPAVGQVAKSVWILGTGGAGAAWTASTPSILNLGEKMLGAVQVFDLLENRDLNWCIISPSSFSGGIFNTIKL